MFLFFLFSSILILELDRMVFLPLGHVGVKQRMQVANDEEDQPLTEKAIVNKENDGVGKEVIAETI